MMMMIIIIIIIVSPIIIIITMSPIIIKTVIRKTASKFPNFTSKFYRIVKAESVGVQGAKRNVRKDEEKSNRRLEKTT